MCKQKPTLYNTRSTRHHLQEPYKESIAQPRKYWSTCHSVEKLSLHAINAATKIIHMRQYVEPSPQKYLSNTPGGVQGA
jgi:hypothetical protein